VCFKALNQCCPSLSLFATCGDEDLNVAKYVFEKYNFNDKYTLSFSSFVKSGKSKAFVANMMIERIWLDTIVLEKPYLV
jgi:hypothetical protein